MVTSGLSVRALKRRLSASASVAAASETTAATAAAIRQVLLIFLSPTRSTRADRRPLALATPTPIRRGYGGIRLAGEGPANSAGGAGAFLPDAEDVLRQARIVNREREHAARQASARTATALGRRDIEGAQVRAAEGACRHVVDRHFDHAIEPAVRRHADDAAAAIAGVPEVPGAVHRRAVRAAALEAGKEAALVGDRPGRSVVVP